MYNRNTPQIYFVRFLWYVIGMHVHRGFSTERVQPWKLLCHDKLTNHFYAIQRGWLLAWHIQRDDRITQGTTLWHLPSKSFLFGSVIYSTYSMLVSFSCLEHGFPKA